MITPILIIIAVVAVTGVALRLDLSTRRRNTIAQHLLEGGNDFLSIDAISKDTGISAKHVLRVVRRKPEHFELEQRLEFDGHHPRRLSPKGVQRYTPHHGHHLWH